MITNTALNVAAIEREGVIISDTRNVNENSRLVIYNHNGTFYAVLKVSGEVVECREGDFNSSDILPSFTVTQLVKLINRLYDKGNYQTGGGLLKDNQGVKYMYYEFLMSIA